TWDYKSYVFNIVYEQEKTVICSMELKRCPDGTYVSRTGENCEFAKCPTNKYQLIYGMSLYSALIIIMCLVLIPASVIACVSCAKSRSKKETIKYQPIPQTLPQDPPSYEEYHYPHVYNPYPHVHNAYPHVNNSYPPVYS